MSKSMQRFILGAVALMLGVVIILALLVFEVPEANREGFNVLAGLALGWGTSAVGFYFGTSQSSADKNDIINSMRKD